MDIYQSFIDTLVERTKSISSKLLIEEGIYSRAITDSKYNDFVENLSIEQRELLAQMFEQEREGAIHDVLSELTFLVDCKDVTLCHKGEVLNTGYEGGMHQDYIGRRSGEWEWPED